jgi:hypothetical protein
MKTYCTEPRSWRPCLGPLRPRHDHYGTVAQRICPKCQDAIDRLHLAHGVEVPVSVLRGKEHSPY